ncbi:MAG TPA: hypothetical protein VGG06_23700 [Thermoanaerobaculia bacterium]|jgi:hypothetical protein
MGRIVAQVEISNPLNGVKPLVCSMFVDTGAASVVLPMAWKDRLGKLANQETVHLVPANNEVVEGLACGPVGIQIEGFRKIFNEVTFMEMETRDNGEYEPLLGYVVLEQAQVAVDMVGHRLVPVKYVDCK